MISVLVNETALATWKMTMLEADPVMVVADVTFVISAAAVKTVMPGPTASAGGRVLAANAINVAPAGFVRLFQRTKPSL